MDGHIIYVLSPDTGSLLNVSTRFYLGVHVVRNIAILCYTLGCPTMLKHSSLKLLTLTFKFIIAYDNFACMRTPIALSLAHAHIVQHWLLCAFAGARPTYGTVYSNGRTRNSRYMTIINKLSLTVHTKDDSVEYTKEFLLEVDIMVLSKLTKTIYLYTNNIHVA